VIIYFGPPCQIADAFTDFVRLGCDLMNFYFVYDEYTDVSDPQVAERLATIVLDAMKYPFAPSKDTHLLGDMTKECVDNDDILPF